MWLMVHRDRLFPDDGRATGDGTPPSRRKESAPDRELQLDDEKAPGKSEKAPPTLDGVRMFASLVAPRDRRATPACHDDDRRDLDRDSGDHDRTVQDVQKISVHLDDAALGPRDPRAPTRADRANVDAVKLLDGVLDARADRARMAGRRRKDAWRRGGRGDACDDRAVEQKKRPREKRRDEHEWQMLLLHDRHLVHEWRYWREPQWRWQRSTLPSTGPTTTHNQRD